MVLHHDVVILSGRLELVPAYQLFVGVVLAEHQERRVFHDAAWALASYPGQYVAKAQLGYDGVGVAAVGRCPAVVDPAGLLLDALVEQSEGHPGED